MKRLFLALVFVFPVAMVAVSEEPPAPKPDIMQAYNALPDEPSAEQEAEFFRVLLDQAVVDLISPQPQGSSGLLKAVGFPQFDEEFFLAGVDSKTMKAIPHPWKKDLLAFLGIRLWLEGKANVEVTPDLEIKRFMVGCRYLMQVLHGITDDAPQFGDTPRRERGVYRKYATERGILERHERMIKDYEDLLRFDGYTVRERVEKWRVSVDALKETDYYPIAAHAAWLWDNVSLKDVKIREVPESIPVKRATTLQEIAREYFADWFIQQEPSLWKEGNPDWSGPKSLTAAMRFCLTPYAANLRNGNAPSKRANLMFNAFVMSFDARCWPDRLYAQVIGPVNEAMKLSHQASFRKAQGSLRLKQQACFKGGGAWFVGETAVDAAKKTVTVEKEFLYPLIEVRYTSEGEQTLNEFEASPMMYPRLLGNSEFFKWTPYVDGVDDPPKFQKRWDVGQDFDYDLSPEGWKTAFGEEKALRFFKGLGGVNPKYKVEDLPNSFTPGVFCHYPETEVCLYTISAYDPGADLVFFDYPITVLVIQPAENAKPDGMMVGLKWKALDTWLGCCGLELKMKRMWNSAEWLEDKANAEALAKADDLCRKLEADRKERWAAGRAEVEKKKKELWGE